MTEDLGHEILLYLASAKISSPHRTKGVELRFRLSEFEAMDILYRLQQEGLVHPVLAKYHEGYDFGWMPGKA